MNAQQAARFGHVDLNDAFNRHTNLVMCFVISWGGSVFFLILGACPAGIVFSLLRGLFPSPLPGVSEDTLVGCAVGCWMGLSFPIAMYRTWVRWQRLRHNELVVGPGGLEILRYPREAVSYDWRSVQSVQYSAADEDKSEELILVTDRGRLVLDSEEWDTSKVRQEVEKYVKVTTI